MMFCRNCGNALNEDQKFCNACGAPVTQEAAVTPAGPVGDVAQAVSPANAKKKTGLIIGVVAAVVLVLTLVLVLAIPGDPADLLMDNTWYSEAEKVHHYVNGEILDFHSNGKAERVFVESNDYGENYKVDYERKPEWQVLEDNVLYFGGRYYEWETEWYVSGSELRIGSQNYTSSDEHGYEKAND